MPLASTYHGGEHSGFCAVGMVAGAAAGRGTFGGVVALARAVWFGRLTRLRVVPFRVESAPAITAPPSTISSVSGNESTSTIGGGAPLSGAAVPPRLGERA